MSKTTALKALTIGYMTTAITMSFIHIVALFLYLNCGWQSWVMPVLIDTIIVIGKLSQAAEFAAKTRRAGRIAVYVGLSLSLTANVTMGIVHESIGEIAIGLVTVGGALWAEHHLSRTAVKAARRPRTTKTTLTPQQKAAATRKRNAAIKAAGNVTPLRTAAN